jgi:hypothetical protein
MLAAEDEFTYQKKEKLYVKASLQSLALAKII